MLNLDKRAATIGTSLNGRAQNHGDEKVPAVDITLEGIVLGERELNAILRDPKASDCLFEPPGGSSTLATPRFPMLDPLRLTEKVEGVQVSIWIASQPSPIVLHGCNLKDVTLEPQEGGTTALSCKVQCTQPDKASVGRLFEQIGHAVAVAIVEAQRDVEDEAA